eukprot:5354537-Amphidinium_carterae.1
MAPNVVLREEVSRITLLALKRPSRGATLSLSSVQKRRILKHKQTVPDECSQYPSSAPSSAASFTEQEVMRE